MRHKLTDHHPARAEETGPQRGRESDGAGAEDHHGLADAQVGFTHEHQARGKRFDQRGDIERHGVRHPKEIGRADSEILGVGAIGLVIPKRTEERNVLTFVIFTLAARPTIATAQLGDDEDTFADRP